MSDGPPPRWRGWRAVEPGTVTGSARTRDLQGREGAQSGQTVVVIGASSGIGLETARQARAAGATLIVTGRDPVRLPTLPVRIAPCAVTGGGPGYSPIADLDVDEALRVRDERLLGALRVARGCAGRILAGRSLTMVTGTHARRPGVGLCVAAHRGRSRARDRRQRGRRAVPMRENAIAAGFADTPLSARVLGGDLEFRGALPIHRVVGAADVAAVALIG